MNVVKRSALGFALIFPYLLLFFWFRAHNIWDVSAQMAAAEIFFWTFMRLLFLVYLLVVFLTMGRILLFPCFSRPSTLTRLEKILFCFFVGSSAVRIIMFIAGLLGLYKPLWVFLCSTFLVFLFPFVFSVESQTMQTAEAPSGWGWKKISLGQMLFIVTLMLGLVYIGRCQFSLDDDYLTHYGPFYNAVIQSGKIAPNDIWYQYFYSKGAGLFYFSMLITDRTGPLLVSFLHLIAATLLVYAVMKRACRSMSWALSASIFLLGMLAWSDAGFFIKHHCEVGAILSGVTCMVVFMFVSEQHRELCYRTACILQVSLLLCALQAGVYVVLFITIYAAMAWYCRRQELALCYLKLLILSMLIAVILLAHNYLLTGLLEVTPFRVFLRFWNQEIFSKWVSPYLLLYVSEGSSPKFGTMGIPSIGPHDIATYARLFRLQKFFFSKTFWLIFSFMVGLALWGKMRDSSKRPIMQKPDVQDILTLRNRLSKWILLPSLLMCLLVFFAYACVRQSISILRFSEFVSIYVTLFVFSLLIICHSFITFRSLHRFTGIIIPLMLSWAVCFWTICGKTNQLANSLQFAFGKITPNEAGSIDRTLSTQYPKIKAMVGHNRIASFNVRPDYGPLFLQYPGIATEVSCRFGNRWHEIVFGDPDTAKKTLRELGINFFLVDLQTPMFGAMPYAPLFTGQVFAKQFRILWRQGSHYLLTWNEGAGGLDSLFLSQWSANLQRGMPSTLKGIANYGQSLYDQVFYLYQFNRGAMQGIVRPAHLKTVEGWQ